MTIYKKISNYLTKIETGPEGRLLHAYKEGITISFCGTKYILPFNPQIVYAIRNMCDQLNLTNEDGTITLSYYTGYAADTDTTIIFCDILNNDTGEVLGTTITGWYFGRPDLDMTEKFRDKILADYTNGGNNNE